ncbi:ABC transporter substrate-binding protein [Mesorhizobium sp. B2-4-19]|uniref:ABC transporter substrate-binding protein n=1 Tax=Mesorhizobium sp. B2-4-19 TaxID=2589930 RepID=UPI0011294806|nr:ABC transporter substrate-binding protein [Mesorhizobium sp. B2-4-19]TPK59112.1 ABC transporter substrate-binding protein [Mesorhizobium sp. B2-4-19]
MTNRRDVLKTAVALSAAASFGCIDPIGFRQARAADKKSLKLASMGPVTGNWDPTSHTTIGQLNVEALIFGRLTSCPMKEDNPTEVLPDLATSWKLIDPGTLEFELRKDVKFHDGKPFAAEDVKATFEYASDPKRPAAAWYPGRVDVEILDTHKIQLKTGKYGYPASAFWFVASFLPILSAKDVADPSALQKRPNGTGPFRHVSTDGDRNTLAAFDDYYGGRPKIDEILHNYVPDANTRVLGLLNGEYHLAERLEPEQYASLSSHADLATYRGLSTENKYLHFRCNKPPFSDERLRRAVCHAIDRSQILALMGDAGVASSCYVSPMKFGYVDVPDYPDYNPEETQKLLAEAGFPKGQGLPELEYITSVGFYAKTKEYGELITAMLQDQGFNVKLTVLEPAAWEQAIYRSKDGQGPGHLVDVGWLTGSPEPDLVLRPNFHSSAALINGVNDPEINASLDKERNTADPKEREKILQTETFPLLAKKVPSFSLFAAVNFHAMSKKLQGVYFLPNGPLDLRNADLV